MKWGVWYIHPRQSFLLTGGMSRSKTRCHHAPFPNPELLTDPSPPTPNANASESGGSPKGSPHSYATRLPAQAREPRPQPRSWDPEPKSAAPCKPHRPSHPHTPPLLVCVRCSLCLLVCLVGCLGFVGCLVCGGCTGAASGGHGPIRGRSVGERPRQAGG